MTELSEVALFTVEAVVAFYPKLVGREPDGRAEGMAIFVVGGVTLFVHSATRAREEDHIDPAR